MALNTASITVEGWARKIELKQTRNGRNFLSIKVPVQKRRKNDRGVWEDDGPATWYEATIFDPAAIAAAQSIENGDRVRITGNLEAEAWLSSSGEARINLRIPFAGVALIERSERRDDGARSADGWSASGYADEPPF